jgi:transcriptional regulator with XRE-family HTH domain
MGRARLLFEKSGLSLEELGQRMGYSNSVARKSAWQFLNKTSDPRLSMLQKFADALSLSIRDVLG